MDSWYVGIKPAGGRYWRTLSALAITTEAAGRVSVPKGFRTDGGSIPPLLWPIIGHPMDPTYYPAAVVHDYLYCRQYATRRCADRAFREFLERLGVAAWRCWAMYVGVRLGGWVGWNRKQGKENG